MKGRIGKLNPYDMLRDECGSPVNADDLLPLDSIARDEGFSFYIPTPTHPVFWAISPASLMVLKFSCVRQHRSQQDEEWRDEREQLGHRDGITWLPCFSLLKGERCFLQHIWWSTLTGTYSKRGLCCQVVCLGRLLGMVGILRVPC